MASEVDIDKLRALLSVLIEADIAEFEHETEAARIRIVRSSKGVEASGGPRATHATTAVASPSPPPTPSQVERDDAGDTLDVTSPFVGTFYRAASPESPLFVEVGTTVRVGQTLCIIEAMKLMNEIEAEHAGTVIEIYAQNGKAVEYGQKLFRLRKA